MSLSTSPRNIARRRRTAARREQRLADLAAIRDLASQDIGGEPESDTYTTCGLDGLEAAERAIKSWHSSAAQAGDHECVEIIDRLGISAAAREYFAARKVRSAEHFTIG